MRADKRSPLKTDKKSPARSHKRGAVGYSKKTALLEEAITQMNAGKYGRSSAALKELLALEPSNMEARRLFATLHLRLGSLIPARQAFDALINEAFERQDYWLAESLLREYLAAGPRCVPFLEKLGSVYQEKGDALEAVTEYGKAIDILIEDPDPDNPQHASQLFAKIRELAPASPMAFRLAPLFDAQTGELIAPPSASRPEMTAPAPAAPEAESLMPDSTTREPAAGVMPWEEGIETPSLDSPASPAAELSAAPTGDSSTAVEIPPVGEAPQPAVPEPALEDRRPSPADREQPSQSLSDAAEVMPTDEVSTEAAATIESMLCEAAASEAVQSSEPEHYVEHPAGLVSGQSPVSAPMPWEQVQDATIDIPQSGSEESSLRLVEAPAVPSAATAPFQETIPESALPKHDAESVEATPEASVGPPSIEAAPDPSLEALKTGKFSWESLFNSTWKFGDAPSEVRQPETKPTGSEPADPVTLVPEESIPVSTDRTPIEQERSAIDVSVSDILVAQPMPWDQVQDAVVTIPPASVDEVSADVPDSETSRQPTSMEEAGQPDATAFASPPVADQSAVSISEPLPVPPSLEPEFCLAPGDQTFSAVVSAPVESSPAPAAGDSESERLSFAMNSAGPAVAEPLEPAEPVPLPSNEKAEQPASQPYEPPALLPSAEAIVTADREAQPAPQLHEELFPAAPAASPSVSANEGWTPAPELHTSPIPAKDLALEPTIPSNTLVQETSVSKTIDASAPAQGDASHWSTGEVAIQTHRPSSKKRKKSSQPESGPADEPFARDEAAYPPVEEHRPQAKVFSETPALLPDPPQREEWIRTGESIRFIESPSSGAVESAPDVSAEPAPPSIEAVSPAAAAVEVLFQSSGRFTKTGSREPVSEPKPRPRWRARLSRIRIAATIFIGSCFSTTRAIATSVTVLAVLLCAMAALGVGGVGLAWLIMEQPPSPAFHSLTTQPQRTLSDPRKNGYLLLLGFDAPAGLDPLQAGYERKPDREEAARSAVCLGGSGSDVGTGQANASASVAQGWFRGGDPASRFTSHEDTIKGWLMQAESSLTRYRQWLKLPFEDWGYGQSLSPPCGAILFAHRLYLAEGFLQGPETGIDRLEADMEAWRIALGQAKTLPVKTMALQAVHDDIALASGLLVRTDFDGKFVGRLMKMLRPLDQVELSIRWPMQSQLVSATKTFAAQLKAEQGEDPPLYAAVAAELPLPKQRRFNAYAAYYEASYKAAGEGRYGSMPKWSHHLRYPADSLLDYLANPIENIVGLEPLAAWDRYNGQVVDTDAHLRLASLQAWLRRGPQDADLLPRIAKAGQNFYDPYTGLPMLVNLKKGVMYSVGHDGKDQDADPQDDIVVAIPPRPSSAPSVKTDSASSVR